MSTDTKIVLGVLVATVLIIAGAAMFSSTRQTATTTGPVAVSNPERLVSDTAPVLGPEDAKVTFVEFGDFECPACGAVHPILQQVKEANKDKSVRFVYRHYPLPQHANADLAAQASVAAQQQGKFWEYHDLLFENQNSLEREDLEKYAQELGLDMDAFKAALDEKAHSDVISKDKADGNAVKVRGTPSIFVNNTQYVGDYSVDAFQAAIDEALAS